VTGPTTGVTIANGEKAIIYWSSIASDFVKITSTVITNFTGIVSPAQGGTGIANGSNNTITFTGNYTLGITLTANSSLTFPTSGSLSTVGKAIAMALVFGF
jgi:hypothetical protein